MSPRYYVVKPGQFLHWVYYNFNTEEWSPYPDDATRYVSITAAIMTAEREQALVCPTTVTLPFLYSEHAHNTEDP